MTEYKLVIPCVHPTLPTHPPELWEWLEERLTTCCGGWHMVEGRGSWKGSETMAMRIYYIGSHAPYGVIAALFRDIKSVFRQGCLYVTFNGKGELIY